MNAVGGLRSRVTLQAPVDVVDDNGGVSRSYASIGDVWAEILPESVVGRLVEDRFIADRMEEGVTHVIRIRWRDGVDAQMRFALGARVFVVHALLDPNERKRFIVCRCEEIKP